MKYIYIIIMCLMALNINAQSYERKGNTFEQVTSSRQRTKFTETEYVYKDSKGKEYKINITSNGRCFVNKISSKTGKTYKYYLSEDICKAICKEMNITYVPKATKK